VPERAFAFLAAAGVLVCAWLAIGPAQLGGPVSYAIVSGSSMEPHLHRGDLVVVRPAGRYQVGDVVAYRTAHGATILHRIIGTAGDRFVVRGDANTWTDPYQPSQRHIVGRLAHRLPGVGRALDWLRSPLPMSLTVGAVSFLIGARYTRQAAV
jgi:signal peptidase